MEKEISRQYRQAQSEITEKWNTYMERAGKRLEKHEAALSNAMRSGDKEEIAKAKKRLEDAKKAITIQDNRYKSVVEETAMRISKSNEIALAYINDRTPNIYANNYNQVNGIAKDAGVQFRIINEDVVRQRIKEGDIKLPKSRLSIPKDVRWNTKKMNSSVLQGILQGESMNQIAKRLLPIVDSNASSAIRNARTLVTQAENSGRLDSYKALEEEGAVLKKVWMATGDERTRDAHLELDGQEVGIDEPFVDMDGNELMFPADPSADPSTVYNCRCTMVTRIEGVNRDTPSMHEEEIERERSRREEDRPQEKQDTGIAATEIKGEDIAAINEQTRNMLGEVYQRHIDTNGMNATPWDDLKDLSISPIRADFGKMPVEVAQYHANTIAGLVNEYDTPLQVVRATMTKEEFMGHSKSFAYVYHDYSVDSATMVLNNSKLKDMDAHIARIKELGEKGYSVKVKEGLEGQYVITHEFAHSMLNMQDTLSNKTNWLNADYGKIKEARKEIKPIYERYMSDVGALSQEHKQLNDDLFQKFFVDMSISTEEAEKQRNAIRVLEDTLKEKKISNYSLSNVDEFMAEAFTDAKLGVNPSEYSLEVKAVIDKHFRRQ